MLHKHNSEITIYFTFEMKNTLYRFIFLIKAALFSFPYPSQFFLITCIRILIVSNLRRDGYTAIFYLLIGVIRCLNIAKLQGIILPKSV